mmetsp:Transcript_10407/g.23555  ORF Transcript_10407/g.23555 Transcript_10407/m.23555 type:complete len:333 (-) Transcript_10407:66-1064(-)
MGCSQSSIHQVYPGERYRDGDGVRKQPSGEKSGIAKVTSASSVLSRYNSECKLDRIEEDQECCGHELYVIYCTLILIGDRAHLLADRLYELAPPLRSAGYSSQRSTASTECPSDDASSVSSSETSSRSLKSDHLRMDSSRSRRSSDGKTATRGSVEVRCGRACINMTIIGLKAEEEPPVLGPDAGMLVCAAVFPQWIFEPLQAWKMQYQVEAVKEAYGSAVQCVAAPAVEEELLDYRSDSWDENVALWCECLGMTDVMGTNDQGLMFSKAADFLHKVGKYAAQDYVSQEDLSCDRITRSYEAASAQLLCQSTELTEAVSPSSQPDGKVVLKL